MHEPLRRLGSALAELRRRRVFHVVAFYAVAAWLAVQVTNIAVPALHLPAWTLTLVFFLALLGFPLAAVLAWAYDVTPDGLERTSGDLEASKAKGRAPLQAEGGGPQGDPTDPVEALRRLARGGEGEPRSAEPVDPGASRAARLMLAVFVLFLTTGLGWLGWQLWIQPAPADVRAAETSLELDPTRIAVLYFDDYSEAGDLGHLANGLTEALIHELTQVPVLDVVSRFGVKPFRGTDVTEDSIVRVLRAGSLVEGSLQRSGDRLRVTVQLVDGATNSHLESATLERPWGELFELQDDLVVQVADLLRRRLGTEIRLREQRAATESVAAWSLVRQAEGLRGDAEELAATGDRATAARILDRADSLLDRAAAEDPSWWEPVLLRGWTAADRARLAGGATLETYDPYWLERGIAEVDRALALRPDEPAALALRGKLRFWLSQTLEGTDRDAPLEAAEADLRAAVAAKSSLAEAWGDLSELLRRRGQPSEAKLAGRRAIEADAFLEDAESLIWQLYQISITLGDIDDADRWCAEGRQRFPELDSFVACSLVLLGLSRGPEPDADRAWALFEELIAMSPERTRMRNELARFFVAATLARANRPDSARAVVAQVRDLGLPPELVPWADYYEANVRLLLDERDSALTLVQSFVETVPGQRERVRSDWMLEDLWDDPRFEALVAAEPGG